MVCITSLSAWCRIAKSKSITKCNKCSLFTFQRQIERQTLSNVTTFNDYDSSIIYENHPCSPIILAPTLIVVFLALTSILQTINMFSPLSPSALSHAVVADSSSSSTTSIGAAHTPTSSAQSLHHSTNACGSPSRIATADNSNNVAENTEWKLTTDANASATAGVVSFASAHSNAMAAPAPAVTTTSPFTTALQSSGSSSPMIATAPSKGDATVLVWNPSDLQDEENLPYLLDIPDLPPPAHRRPRLKPRSSRVNQSGVAIARRVSSSSSRSGSTSSPPPRGFFPALSPPRAAIAAEPSSSSIVRVSQGREIRRSMVPMTPRPANGSVGTGLPRVPPLQASRVRGERGERWTNSQNSHPIFAILRSLPPLEDILFKELQAPSTPPSRSSSVLSLVPYVGSAGYGLQQQEGQQSSSNSNFRLQMKPRSQWSTRERNDHQGLMSVLTAKGQRNRASVLTDFLASQEQQSIPPSVVSSDEEMDEVPGHLHLPTSFQ